MVLARILGGFLVCFGTAMLVAAVLLYQDTRTFAAHATQAPGTIVGMNARRGQKGGMIYSPIVRFTDRDGNMHQFTSSRIESPPVHHIGEIATVLYDVTKPQEAHLSGFMDLWLDPLILAGLGLVFSLVGAGSFVGFFTKNTPSDSHYGKRRGRVERTRKR